MVTPPTKYDCRAVTSTQIGKNSEKSSKAVVLRGVHTPLLAAPSGGSAYDARLVSNHFWRKFVLAGRPRYGEAYWRENNYRRCWSHLDLKIQFSTSSASNYGRGNVGLADRVQWADGFTTRTTPPTDGFFDGANEKTLRVGHKISTFFHTFRP